MTDRELAVLRYLPSRLSQRDIASELYVSLNTVKPTARRSIASSASATARQPFRPPATSDCSDRPDPTAFFTRVNRWTVRGRLQPPAITVWSWQRRSSTPRPVPHRPHARSHPPGPDARDWISHDGGGSHVGSLQRRCWSSRVGGWLLGQTFTIFLFAPAVVTTATVLQRGLAARQGRLNARFASNPFSEGNRAHAAQLLLRTLLAGLVLLSARIALLDIEAGGLPSPGTQRTLVVVPVAVFVALQLVPSRPVSRSLNVVAGVVPGVPGVPARPGS